MMIEIKPLAVISGVILFLATSISSGDTLNVDVESECKINVDSLERALDKRLVEQSYELGRIGVKKDSGVRQLTKVCSVLKIENKVLKVENKTLKTNLEIVSTKAPDTVVRTIFVKKGLFGKETHDTVNE